MAIPVYQIIYHSSQSVSISGHRSEVIQVQYCVFVLALRKQEATDIREKYPEKIPVCSSPNTSTQILFRGEKLFCVFTEVSFLFS